MTSVKLHHLDRQWNGYSCEAQVDEDQQKASVSGDDNDNSKSNNKAIKVIYCHL